VELRVLPLPREEDQEEETKEEDTPTRIGNTYIKPTSHKSDMKKPIALLLIALLAMTMATAIIPASAEETIKVHVTVDNGRHYYNPTIGLYTKKVSFYYITGPRIVWWNGGVKFVYTENATAINPQKIMQMILRMFRELGFVTIMGEVTPRYFLAVIGFNGILEWNGLWFIDDNGLAVIEWKQGSPVNITVYAKATVNKTASIIEQYGKADWQFKPLNGGTGIMAPTAIIEVPKDEPYQILVVPTEGIVQTIKARVWKPATRTEVSIERILTVTKTNVFNYYLGGAPTLKTIAPDSIGDMVVALKPDKFYKGLPISWKPAKTIKVYEVETYQSFWHRQPTITLIFKDSETETLKHDLFYGHEYPAT